MQLQCCKGLSRWRLSGTSPDFQYSSDMWCIFCILHVTGGEMESSSTVMTLVVATGTSGDSLTWMNVKALQKQRLLEHRLGSSWSSDRLDPRVIMSNAACLLGNSDRFLFLISIATRTCVLSRLWSTVLPDPCADMFFLFFCMLMTKSTVDRRLCLIQDRRLCLIQWVFLNTRALYSAHMYNINVDSLYKKHVCCRDTSATTIYFLPMSK